MIATGKLTLEQVRALRIGTEHNPIIRPNQAANFAKYNVMPAFNGYQVQGDIKGGQFLKAYGEQYMNWLAPMKSLVDAGHELLVAVGHGNADAGAFMDRLNHYRQSQGRRPATSLRLRHLPQLRRHRPPQVEAHDHVLAALDGIAVAVPSRVLTKR